MEIDDAVLRWVKEHHATISIKYVHEGKEQGLAVVVPIIEDEATASLAIERGRRLLDDVVGHVLSKGAIHEKNL